MFFVVDEKILDETIDNIAIR